MSVRKKATSKVVKKTTKKVAKKTAKKVPKKVAKKKTRKKAAKKIASQLASGKLLRKLVPDEERGLDLINNPVHIRKALLKAKRIHGNKEKKKIAEDILERYTGHSLKDFQKQIILTNFHY